MRHIREKQSHTPEKMKQEIQLNLNNRHMDINIINIVNPVWHFISSEWSIFRETRVCNPSICTIIYRSLWYQDGSHGDWRTMIHKMIPVELQRRVLSLPKLNKENQFRAERPEINLLKPSNWFFFWSTVTKAVVLSSDCKMEIHGVWVMAILDFT